MRRLWSVHEVPALARDDLALGGVDPKDEGGGGAPPVPVPVLTIGSPVREAGSTEDSEPQGGEGGEEDAGAPLGRSVLDVGCECGVDRLYTLLFAGDDLVPAFWATQCRYTGAPSPGHGDGDGDGDRDGC
jgi:hypothetical protein